MPIDTSAIDVELMSMKKFKHKKSMKVGKIGLAHSLLQRVELFHKCN